MKRDNPADLAKELGKRISSLRIAAGLTQEYVAENLGIGSEAVSRIERGVAVPNAIRLLELAEILGCRTDELLHGSSSRLADQTAYLEDLLAKVSAEDRGLLISVLESLVGRLKTSNHGKKQSI